ncbi:hypothetical protein HZH68_001563 [Vespula germanica]|uniref:Uncharacterized protein n=1 Tax=Vespula germanica TaxID=30212 RepID=A0A834NVV1_VESGE|nr:hypothetical protein HZH68_001563 [Vespula germanica]
MNIEGRPRMNRQSRSFEPTTNVTSKGVGGQKGEGGFSGRHGGGYAGSSACTTPLLPPPPPSPPPPPPPPPSSQPPVAPPALPPSPSSSPLFVSTACGRDDREVDSQGL